MNFISTIALFAFGVLFIWQSGEAKPTSFTVVLEATDCASTRRMRCDYRFAEVSYDNAKEERRRFNLVFYLGADQDEENADAITRLDRLFEIKRETSTAPGKENTGNVGYKKALKLRIQGSKYGFDRENGKKTVVDIAKRTRP